MYCYNCGKEIAETVKFCPYCGAEQKQPQQSPQWQHSRISARPAAGTPTAPHPAATRPMAEPPAAGHSMAGPSAAHPAAEPSGGE